MLLNCHRFVKCILTKTFTSDSFIAIIKPSEILGIRGREWMFKRLKQLFSNTCPECGEKLSCSSQFGECTKECPHGHYKEETLCAFGIRIIYKP